MNTRVRMQSYRSARFSSGWICHISGNEFGVKFHGTEHGTVGDRYHLEVNDGKNLVLAEVSLLQCDGSIGTFRLCGDLRYVKQTENLRLKSSFQGFLTVNNEAHPVRVIDLSDEGVGLYTNIALSRLQYATIEAVLDQQTIKLVGRAVYCRKLDGEDWQYRIGLFIPGLNHLIDPEEGDLRKARANPSEVSR